MITLFSSIVARVFSFGSAGGSASTNNAGSIALTSESGGVISLNRIGRVMMIVQVMIRFQLEKIVAVVGMMPVSFSTRCPLVATASGIEPEMPPCQMTKPE